MDIKINVNAVKSHIKLHKTKTGTNNNFRFIVPDFPKLEIDYYPIATVRSMDDLTEEILNYFLRILARDFQAMYDKLMNDQINSDLKIIALLDKFITNGKREIIAYDSKENPLGVILTVAPINRSEDYVLMVYPEAESYEEDC